MTGIVFREGFDSYNGTGGEVGSGTRWAKTGLSVGPSIVSGRFSGQGLQIENTGSNLQGYSAAFDSDVTDFCVSAAVWKSNYGANHGGSDIGLKQAGSSGGTGYCLGLRFPADGSIEIIRQTEYNSYALLAVSDPDVLQSFVWTHIEWFGTLDNSAGEAFVCVNGNPTPVVSVTGADTAGYGTAAGRINIGPSNWVGTTAFQRFDDIVVRNVNQRFGQRRVETLRINGNGAHQDSTPSTGTDRSACVDEIPASTSDFVTMATPGMYDEYTLTDPSGNPDFIEEVTAIMYARKNDVDTRAVSLGLDIDGFVNDSADLYLGESFGKYQRSLELNPDGDVEWTKAVLSATLARPKLVV